jgi:hypothetical protein
MSKIFRTIDNSELEDFETECRACGLDPKEFTLEEHDYIETPAGGPIFTPNAKVTVSRNDKKRTYNTGNATHWVYDFAMDLRKGVFK